MVTLSSLLTLVSDMSYSYHAESSTTGNLPGWSYGYDDKGQVTSAQRARSASPQSPISGQDWSFEYDEIGNRKNASHGGYSTTYQTHADGTGHRPRRDRAMQPPAIPLGPAALLGQDHAEGARLINARSETVAKLPAYRSAFKSRRCLVVADGFYEWIQTTKPKQPLRFILNDPETHMLMAGLWETWRDPHAEEPLHTFTICTTTSNELVG